MRISDWSSDVCSSDLPREKRGLISRSCNTRNTWEMGSRFRGNDGRVDRENSEIHFRKSLVAPRLACFDARHEDAPPPRASARAVRHLRLRRSEEHTSELQSLMRISYAVFCLKKKT